MEPNLATRHLERNRMQAAKAFSKHVITKESEGRWLLQTLYPGGKPDWTMAAEIIVLAGGALYVGGDIDHMVYSSGPSDPIARVRWMGECNDLAYYVRQKARIGNARNQDCVDEWHEDIAREQLAQYRLDLIEGNDGEPLDPFDADAYDLAMHADSRESFLNHASEAFGGEYDCFESIGRMGMVLSPAVIYTHAALQRLCVLLREREATESSAEHAPRSA